MEKGGWEGIELSVERKLMSSAHAISPGTSTMETWTPRRNVLQGVVPAEVFRH